MRLDCQQHFGESAENVSTDRFALIGTANRPDAPLVGRHAEMIRPEPDQPLHETIFCAKRGLDTRLGLVQIDLLGYCATWHHPREDGLIAGLLICRRTVGHASAWRGSLHAAFCLSRCSAPLPVAKRLSRGRTAGVQIVLGDHGSVGAIELGEQCAARVRRNGSNRPQTRTQTEPVQREGSFGLTIKDHPCISLASRTKASPMTQDGRIVHDNGVVDLAARRLSRS
jgi:hypothetical protein